VEAPQDLFCYFFIFEGPVCSIRVALGVLVLEYLLVMLVFTLPFILFALYKRHFSALGLAAVMGLVIGVPWDTISAGFFHTWFWNQKTLIGLMIGPLPLEEYLFMMLVPMMLVGAALAFKVNLYESAPR
jgi:lycopene cyclase domain-containing protein